MPDSIRIFCTLIFGVLLVGGCSIAGSEGSTTDEIEIINDFSRFSQDSTRLVDEWHWRRTVCCFGTWGVETPESTGETETLVVTEGDTVRVYRNEKLEEKTTLRDYLNRAQWGVSEDRLVVSWVYIDGPQRVYVRDE